MEQKAIYEDIAKKYPRKTAEILGISYKTLYNKTKKYKAAGGADEDDEE